MCPIKLPTKRIFWIFHILKINRIMLFCNLFIGRPSYVTSACMQAPKTNPQGKSVTLNNLEVEWLNGPYFSLFYQQLWGPIT